MINKKIVALLLVICFLFNPTAVLAASSYTDQNAGVRTISVQEEKERLQKKFSGLKDWIQEVTPFESSAEKRQPFFSFRESLNKFFDGLRIIIETQWERNFTTL